jgi:hypothetical protein
MVDVDVDWTRVKAWLTRPFIGCCFPEPDADAPDVEAEDPNADADDAEPPVLGIVAQPEADPERLVPPAAPTAPHADMEAGGVDPQEAAPDAEAADTPALLQAWLLVREELPEEWHDAAMQWLQRVEHGNYMGVAKGIIACYEQDEFVATPDDQAPAATSREAEHRAASAGDDPASGSNIAAASRVARFDINAPGEERIIGEGGRKEFAMRQKHKAERVRQMVQANAEESIYGGRYFSKQQQDEWTARTLTTGGRNLICNQSGEPIHSPKDTMNFVVVDDADYQAGNGERLILCPEKTATGAKYSTHSQLARGLPVKYAGEMWFDTGVISKYNLKAGHYRQPMARKANKLRDHQLQIARLKMWIESRSAADTGDDEEYRNGEQNQMRLVAIEQEFAQSQEKAAKFAQYIAKKFGPYVDTNDAADIDDDVSTVDLTLEEVSGREAGA